MDVMGIAFPQAEKDALDFGKFGKNGFAGFSEKGCDCGGAGADGGAGVVGVKKDVGIKVDVQSGLAGNGKPFMVGFAVVFEF